MNIKKIYLNSKAIMDEAEIIDFKLFLHFLLFIFTTVLLDDCGLNSSRLEVASINVFKLRFEKSEQTKITTNAEITK